MHEIATLLFLFIYSHVPFSWAARHTTMCLNSESATYRNKTVTNSTTSAPCQATRLCEILMMRHLLCRGGQCNKKREFIFLYDRHFKMSCNHLYVQFAQKIPSNSTLAECLNLKTHSLSNYCSHPKLTLNWGEEQVKKDQYKQMFNETRRIINY